MDVMGGLRTGIKAVDIALDKLKTLPNVSLQQSSSMNLQQIKEKLEKI